MSVAALRLRPMRAADLPGLPAEVARCARRPGWPDEVLTRWNACGVIGNGEPASGWLTFVPEGEVALITAVFVAEDRRGCGLGRQLVQTAAGLLVRREVRALEVTGSYPEPISGSYPASSCAPPVAWLEKVGFRIVRPDPLHPRLRMDLAATVRWRPDLSAAWSRLTGLVRQPSAPEPATYTHRQRADAVAADAGMVG